MFKAIKEFFFGKLVEKTTKDTVENPKVDLGVTEYSPVIKPLIMPMEKIKEDKNSVALSEIVEKKKRSTKKKAVKKETVKDPTVKKRRGRKPKVTE